VLLNGNSRNLELMMTYCAWSRQSIEALQLWVYLPGAIIVVDGSDSLGTEHREMLQYLGHCIYARRRDPSKLYDLRIPIQTPGLH